MITAVRNNDYLGICIRAAAAVDKPVNLAFLIDVSESMSGERLTAVKKTLHCARDIFRAEDRVTVVTFGEDAKVVTNNLLLAADGMDHFYAAIDAIGTAGCTNLSAGIEALLTLQNRESPFDAVMLLTDGVVNRGITSGVGLRTMAQGLGQLPITALGYGADHNRVLLRDLALMSRGAYVFIDAESLLPTVMGDLIGGVRTEVLKNASIQVPAGWDCCEVGGDGNSYRVGNVVSGRDYWAVFRKKVSGDPIDAAPLVLVTGRAEVGRIEHVPISGCQDLQEQVLRARVGRAIVDASDRMEQRMTIGPEVRALAAEFDTLSAEMLCRPLVLRMKAQLAEILDVNPVMDMNSLPPPNAVLARMSSGGACLSVQRGVIGIAEDPALFSSSTQRATSSQVQSQYEV